MKQSKYYLIPENVHGCPVFYIGQFESLAEAWNKTDIEHYTHGESCIIIAEERIEDLIASLRKLSKHSFQIVMPGADKPRDV